MPTAAVPVRDATPKDQYRIAWLLAAGFYTAPLVQWLLPPLDWRRHHFSLFFDRMVGVALEDPQAAVHITIDGAAASIWYDHRNTSATDALCGISALMPADTQPWVVDRLNLLREWLGDLRPTMAHYRLGYLAVDRNQRKQGLAKALLAYQHHRLDLAGVASFAVAQTDADMALLSRAGYHTGRPLSAADGPPVWPAWRPPQPAYPTQRTGG